MSKTLIGCGILALGVILVVALMVGGIYNRLVGLEESVDAAWGQVENVYQRRADLIPNLVATVKGAADFEKSTLEAVTEARASVGRAQLPQGMPTDPAQLQSYEIGRASCRERV